MSLMLAINHSLLCLFCWPRAMSFFLFFFRKKNGFKRRLLVKPVSTGNLQGHALDTTLECCLMGNQDGGHWWKPQPSRTSACSPVHSRSCGSTHSEGRGLSQPNQWTGTHTNGHTLIMGGRRVLGALMVTQCCFGTVIRANEDQVLHLKATFRKIHFVSFREIGSRWELQVLAWTNQTSGLQMEHYTNCVNEWAIVWLELVAWTFRMDANSEYCRRLNVDNTIQLLACSCGCTFLDFFLV